MRSPTWSGRCRRWSSTTTPSNTWFGTHHVVDPSAEATVVLVHLLLEQLGEPVAADAAASLYAGLATDTAFFRNVTAHTHRLAAELVDSGADPVEVLRPIGDSHPVRVAADAVHRARPGRTGPCGGRRSRARPHQRDPRRLRRIAPGGTRLDHRHPAHRPGGRRGRGRQGTGPGRWQISLRWRPGVDVAAAADRLGGGGHVRAAGFSWSGSYPDAIDALRAVLASDPSVAFTS